MTSESLVFIGDIHGEYQQLSSLLKRDITATNERCSEKLVFIGDLIDTKYKDEAIDQLGVLTLVKGLVDSGRAHCIMGNHELNAIGWSLKKLNTGEYERPHTEKNYQQHGQFIETVGEGSNLHQHWIAWFKTLPLYYEADDVRAIHAYWNSELISELKAYLNQDGSLKEQHWHDAFNEEHRLFFLLEQLLKGPHIKLPKPYSFTDQGGHVRHQVRIKWWQDEAKTYRDLAASIPDGQLDGIPDIVLPADLSLEVQDKMTFIGHYKLPYSAQGKPYYLSEKVACLDFYDDHRCCVTAFRYRQGDSAAKLGFL